MGSSQNSPRNAQSPEGDVIATGPKEGPIAAEGGASGPASVLTFPRDLNRVSMTPEVNASEQTVSTSAGQVSEPDAAPQPAAAANIASVSKVTATSSQPEDQLEVVARELAAVLGRGRDSSDRSIGIAPEGSDLSVLESPRPFSFKNDQSASARPSTGRRVIRTAALLFAAALIVVGAVFVWQIQGVSTTKSPSSFAVAANQAIPAEQMAAPDAARQPARTTPVPAAAVTSPGLAQQLELVARHLAELRDSVEQLAAKQEQMTQDIAALQATAAKHEHIAQDIAILPAIAAKQEQMAQDIATLQALEQAIRQKLSLSAPTQAVPLPPRKPVVQSLSLARPTLRAQPPSASGH